MNDDSTADHELDDADTHDMDEESMSDGSEEG